jgi:hypothetical protein
MCLLGGLLCLALRDRPSRSSYVMMRKPSADPKPSSWSCAMGGINSQIAPEENTIIMRVQKTSVRLIANATIPVSIEEAV